MLLITGLTITAGQLGMSLWARRKKIMLRWYDWVIMGLVLLVLPLNIKNLAVFLMDNYPFFGMTSLLIFYVMSVTIPLVIGVWYLSNRFLARHREEEKLDIVP
jgi:hypothetical protein